MLEPNTPPRADYAIDSINKEEISSYVDKLFNFTESFSKLGNG